jgi:hypothetical protein
MRKEANRIKRRLPSTIMIPPSVSRVKSFNFADSLSLLGNHRILHKTTAHNTKRGRSPKMKPPFKIDQPYTRVRSIIFLMKKELNPKQVLAVRCPTCGAAPGEKCELSTGQPRMNPHRDRRLIAAD